MSAIDAYHLYTSIRLHFTRESYDCFKYNFKSQVSEESFALRKDRYLFLRLSRMFPTEECKLFLASNFLANPKCFIRELLETAAKDIWLERKRVIESLSYTFTSDLEFLFKEYRDPTYSLVCKHDYPPLLLHVWRSEFNVESLIILNHFLHFLPVWNKKISDTVVWPEYYHRVRKYTPFMSFDGDVFKKIIQEKMKEIDKTK